MIPSIQYSGKVKTMEKKNNGCQGLGMEEGVNYKVAAREFWWMIELCSTLSLQNFICK